MQTRLGGVVTIIIYTYVLMYASLKFSYFISRNKPTMFSYLKDNDYSLKGEDINLGYRNFRIAVTIEDFFPPKKLKNDERYVKWIFRLYGKTDGIFYQHMLSYHKCTDDDYSEFYPVQKQSFETL